MLDSDNISFLIKDCIYFTLFECHNDNDSTGYSKDVEKPVTDNTIIFNEKLKQFFFKSNQRPIEEYSEPSFKEDLQNLTSNGEYMSENKKLSEPKEKKKKAKKYKSKKNSLRRYICLDCYNIYKSKENWLLHYRNFHLNEKPYQCSFCENSFSNRAGKIYHERKFHTGVFPYVCKEESKKRLFYF